MFDCDGSMLRFVSGDRVGIRLRGGGNRAASNAACDDGAKSVSGKIDSGEQRLSSQFADVVPEKVELA